MPKTKLTQKRLKALLRYDRKTGEFYWRVQQGTRSDLVGKRAGWLEKVNDYWRLRAAGTTYRAHHLAWLYVYGRLPREQLDHINHKRGDNRIVNLREANNQQNQANAKKQKNNTSGYKGVYRKNKTWCAMIYHNNKLIHLGMFDTPKKAHTAHCTAAKRLRGKFFCPG